MSDAVKKIIADTLGIAEAEISDAADAQSLPGWDSGAHINIILSLEAAYGTSFNPVEVIEMTSLKQIHQALEQHGLAAK